MPNATTFSNLDVSGTATFDEVHIASPVFSGSLTADTGTFANTVTAAEFWASSGVFDTVDISGPLTADTVTIANTASLQNVSIGASVTMAAGSLTLPVTTTNAAGTPAAGTVLIVQEASGTITLNIYSAPSSTWYKQVLSGGGV